MGIMGTWLRKVQGGEDFWEDLGHIGPPHPPLIPLFREGTFGRADRNLGLGSTFIPVLPDNRSG
jgi:hypothetical protein